MFIRRVGHPVIAYGPSDGGGAAPPPAESTPPVNTPPANQPPANTPPAGAPWKDGELYNIGDKPWYDTLPDQGVKDLITAKAYKTPAELAKAYSEINTLVSSQGMVKIPGPDATDSEKAAFATKLGRPESIDGYKDVKWGDNADPNLVEFGKNLAFNSNMSPESAQKLADTWNEMVGKQSSESLEAFRLQNEADVQAVRTREGEQFDAHIAAGQGVVNALGLDTAAMSKIEGAIGAAPMIDLFARIGKATQGGTLIGGGNGGQNVDTMTAEQAKAEIARLQSDKDFNDAYNSKTHPQHADKVSTMERLYAKAGSLL